ncbi:MAG: hypothetical protein ACM3ZA_09265 [Bacillota bacterium]
MVQTAGGLDNGLQLNVSAPVLAIVLVFMVMAAEFESFVHPFVITAQLGHLAPGRRAGRGGPGRVRPPAP